MRRHTPGPWQWIRGPASLTVGIFDELGRGKWIANLTDHDNHIPDAVLISAAPDLLAACKEVYRVLRSSPYEEDLDRACAALITAIAKAEGDL